MSSFVAIVGSAHSEIADPDTLQEVVVGTGFGDAILHRRLDIEREAYLLFRHGLPHRLLPNQINYRANIAALRELECRALLVTSSVGVMIRDVPLFVPMFASDVVMLENRLPDGTACTMWPETDSSQGHLVLDEGLFSHELKRQLQAITPIDEREPVFVYVQGPRTKTGAENRLLPTLGGEVNSMTFAPEVILANEYEIPVCGVVVGHKRSLDQTDDELDIETSLIQSRNAMDATVDAFLREIEPVPFANTIYRF